MADVLVRYSVGIRPGDWVVIQSEREGEPLVDACVRAVLSAGGHPSVLFGSETIRESVLRHASEEQLQYISPILRAAIEGEDATISILAPSNTRAVTGIEPSKFA